MNRTLSVLLAVFCFTPWALLHGHPQQGVGSAGDERTFRPATVPVGVNVAKLGFEGGGISRTELPFCDMMKVSHGFDAVDPLDQYPGGASVLPYRLVFSNLDADGYPMEGVPFNGYAYATYIGRGISGRYPGGSYIVSFEGTGMLDFSGDVQSVTPLGANQFLLEVTPTNAGIVIRILSSAGGTERVRKLRVVPEDLADRAGDPVQPFHPEFLARLDALGPKAMRFHNWKRVTSATVATLAAETPETFYTYDRSVAGGGVPWTVIADLCGTVGAEPWINIPYDADLEAYVRPLAAQFADWSLATGLRIHVEYGNEVWNPTFANQYCWILDDQQDCVPCDPSNPPPVNGTIQQCIAEFNVAHSSAIHTIFVEELGARGIGDRVVRVLGGWASNGFYTNLLLGEIQESDAIDTLAIQSYFGSLTVRQLGWSTLQTISAPGLVNYLHRSIEGQPGGNLRQLVRSNADLLEQLNDRLDPPDDIALAAYEGGQSLIFDVCDCPDYCPAQLDPICRAEIAYVSQVFNSLNRDPEMLELYAHVFDVWDEFTADDAGVSGLWMHFSLFDEYSTAGQGSWGLFEYYDDPIETAWKFLALLAVQQD